MLSDLTDAHRSRKRIKWWKEAVDLELNGPENEKGERLVTSEGRLDRAIDSARIRQQVRDVFDL